MQRKTIRERLDVVGFNNDDLLAQMGFIDPVTLEPMDDPVTADDLATYDRTTALNLIARRSPGATHLIVTKILHDATVTKKSIDDFVTALERAHQHAQANLAPQVPAVAQPQDPRPQNNRRQIGDLTWGFIEELARKLSSLSTVSDITEAELGIKGNYDRAKMLWSLLCANVVSNYQELKELYSYYAMPGLLIPHRLTQTQSSPPVPFEGQTLKSMLHNVAPHVDLVKLQNAFKLLSPSDVSTLSQLKVDSTSGNPKLLIRNLFTKHPNLSVETIANWIGKDLQKPGLADLFRNSAGLAQRVESRNVVPQPAPTSSRVAPQPAPSSVGYFSRPQVQWRAPAVRNIEQVINPEPVRSTRAEWQRDSPPAHVKAAYNAILTNNAVHEEIIRVKRLNDYNNPTLLARELFAVACVFNEQTFRALLVEFNLTGLISLYADQKRTEAFFVIADNFYDEYKAIFDGMSASDRQNLNALVLNTRQSTTPILLVRDLVFAGHLKPGPEAESSLYALLERGNLTHLLDQPEPSRPMVMGGMVV